MAKVETIEASAKNVEVYQNNGPDEPPVLLIQGSIGAAWHSMDLRLGLTREAAQQLVLLLEDFR